MAEISRFFDHIDGDRTYNAEEFAEYFRQILTTGVLDTGDNLRVYANGTDRIARIKPGKAWIEGYFYKLTEELELPLEEAHGTYDRIDRIVLRLNTSTESRNIKAFVKTGELSLTPEPPALIREGNIYEISLAQIFILHNTTSIPVDNVTDERLDSTVCGLANLALTYEEFALKVDTGDINDDTLPAELKGKPLTEQIMYVLENAGSVESVNGKTGRVEIDVADIPNLNATRVILGRVEGYMGSMHGGVAIGNNITMPPSGNNALTVIGRNLNVGDSTIVLGTNSNVQDYGLSIGNQAHSENGATVIGERSTASGLGSFLVGNNGEASGEWAFSLAGGKSINNNVGIIGIDGTLGTNKWIVPGAFTVQGTKNFEIPHPKPEKQSTHVIRHGAVESPTAGDTLYRYKVQANKDGDLVVIDLPDYFIYLNKNVQTFVTPQGHFGNGYGELNRETEQLEIHCQYEGEYNVLVIGTRNDDHQSIRDWDIKGVEREIGESWTGETYVFEVDEIIEVEEIKEVV